LDLAAVLKAFYSCGILDGMLKAMITVGNEEAANEVREALKQTSCEQIRKYADVGSSAANSTGMGMVKPYLLSIATLPILIPKARFQAP
jgi:hypothetical protein